MKPRWLLMMAFMWIQSFILTPHIQPSIIIFLSTVLGDDLPPIASSVPWHIHHRAPLYSRHFCNYLQCSAALRSDSPIAKQLAVENNISYVPIFYDCQIIQSFAIERRNNRFDKLLDNVDDNGAVSTEKKSSMIFMFWSAVPSGHVLAYIYDGPCALVSGLLIYIINIPFWLIQASSVIGSTQ